MPPLGAPPVTHASPNEGGGGASAPATGKRVPGDEQPAVVIELAGPEDYAAIDRLIEEAYAHDYGPSDPAERGDPTRSASHRAERFDVWVARAGGELLGSVTSRRIDGPSLHEDVPAGEIDVRLLGVASTARRRGIGALLMGHIVAEAERQGAAAVSLKTQPFMHGAHRLYDSLGFERRPDRDGLWIGGVRVLDLHGYVRRL